MFALTSTPPANAFVHKDLLEEKQDCYPLEFYRCDACGHLQLTEIVAPEVLFRHYVYVSSTSPVMVNHLQATAEAVIRHAQLKSDDLVVEFGSNDGTLLHFFKNRGMKVLGIDPARNIAEVATNSGVETLPEFFAPEIARLIKASRGSARAICANNVCAHIDDLGSIFDAVQILLANDGLFVFEVGYLRDVVCNAYFDTIYHEHVDFHHVEPLVSFCLLHGLQLVHVERVNIQGGSIRCYVQHNNGPYSIDPSVDNYIDDEHAAGLHLPETYRYLGLRIEQRRVELVSLLAGLKSQGKKIAAFGAPAKATTLMYHFGLSKNIIDFIVDENPLKQGLFTPGLHVPVVHPDALQNETPDYLVVLAWNFADNIMQRYGYYVEQGGRFIVPLPNLALYGDKLCG
jgi:SAM-dependent methyltransferase